MKIRGLEELHGKLNELGDELAQQKKLRSVARRAFKPVLDSAKAKVPVDTGILRDSIAIAGASPKETVAAVGLVVRKLFKSGDPRFDASWRWHFIELGTRFKAARPFMRPALDSNSQVVLANVKDLLQKAIKNVIRKRARDKARSIQLRGEAGGGE